MKIVVFEDNPDLLAVVDGLRPEYPDYEFLLCSKAGVALEQLRSGADALISDFFGPVEVGEIENLYQEQYVNQFRSDSFDLEMQWEECACKRLVDSSFYPYRSQVDYLFGDWEDKRFSQDKYFREYHGYGGVLMLLADELHLASVLVTDLHRHSRDPAKGNNPVHGMFILGPLMLKEIFSPEELNNYGGDQGPRLISSTGYDKPGKDNPDCWRKAIANIEFQGFTS